MSITAILTPEEYQKRLAKHPEAIQALEDVNFHGLKFTQSKPTTTNRAMRRAAKRRKP